MSEATSCEIFRLSGDARKDEDESNWKRGPVLEKARTRDIATRLLSDDSYLFSMRAECKPRWGVVLRLRSDQDAVTVLFCFECGFLTFKERAPTLDFSPSNEYWTRLAKEAFPGDPAIQALKAKDMPLEEKARLDAKFFELARELEEKKARKDGEIK